jgi:DNA repair exonuclease SbcCD nuclease subunit
MEKQLDKDIIIIGDSHWGIKKFNLGVLEDQLSVFHNQIFPYMRKNNIKTIFSLGDLLDNRTTADIGWLIQLKKDFFDILKAEGFILYELLGNHDIYRREDRKISLVDHLSDLYLDNFIVFKDREYINVGEQRIYVVPWITKNETLLKEELQDIDYVFGHFEVRNFAMVPGHIDNSSQLTEGFFKENKRLKGVYSGHYHLRNISGFLKYLGSLTQINWSDYNDMKGFYHFDGFSLDYNENISSKKYIKVKYNDEQNTDRNIEVKGLWENTKLLTNEEFDILLPELQKHEIKTFINKHKDDSYEEVLYKMKKAKVQTTVVNNQELSEMIGMEYIVDEEHIEQKDTKTLIIDTLQSSKPELMTLLNSLLSEIDSENIEE